MSKDKQNDTSSPKGGKKGLVIDRRRNRTLPQGRATSDPKWEMVHSGVLVRKGSGGIGGANSNPIVPTKGGFASVKMDPVTHTPEPVWIKGTDIAQASQEVPPAETFSSDVEA